MTEMWEFCEDENSGRINNKYRKPAVWGGPAVRFTPRKAFRNIAKMTNPRNQYKFTHGFLDTTGYDCYTFSRYGGIAKW